VRADLALRVARRTGFADLLMERCHERRCSGGRGEHRPTPPPDRKPEDSARRDTFTASNRLKRLTAARDCSCHPSSAGLKIFSIEVVPGLPAPNAMERTKSAVTEPPSPLAVRVEAMGRARRLTTSARSPSGAE